MGLRVSVFLTEDVLFQVDLQLSMCDIYVKKTMATIDSKMRDIAFDKKYFSLLFFNRIPSLISLWG